MRLTQGATVASWITPKAAKGVASPISGQGVRVLSDIEAGEPVAVKGGHIVDRPTVERLSLEIRNSAFQIAPDLYLAALHMTEYDDVMMRINHSCEPNVGVVGNVVIVAKRQIEVGEELTLDYATFIVDPDFEMDCQCGSARCRGTVRGTDWTRAELQGNHRGWFAWHVQRLIDQGATAG